ncbi:glycine betaine ABC transporter substrate-binding protein [Candidatus Riflebacteria bacterium]
MRLFSMLFCILMLRIIPVFCADLPLIRVGSKTFTESYILAEIISQIIEDVGEARVDRSKIGLGGTGIIYNALKLGEIDIYPEYTGTLQQVILKNNDLRSFAELSQAVGRDDLIISKSLGFNNTYALGVHPGTAKKYGLQKISDLKKYPGIKAGPNPEFLKRKDGLGALMLRYDLDLRAVNAMEHSLAYEAIKSGQIEMMDIYTTDAKIKKYGLVVLDDDREFFPKYYAILFAHSRLAEKFPRTWKALKALEGSIDEQKMIALNALVELDKKSFAKTAAIFLKKDPGKVSDKRFFSNLFKWTKEHIFLVLTALAASVLVGLPLGIIASKNPMLAQVVLIATGLLQTIPSLALLCFLIPIMGIGTPPALLALFLYGLLPIVRNTYLGVHSIDKALKESAKVLGLTPWQQLIQIELPLAAPAILGGIKTSAIISVGTATLAAFIGAGGYGTPIVTGLALNDSQIILQGAIPAALLAIAVHAMFEIMDRIFIPESLRG